MKITLPLESGEWQGFATERMWAQKVTDNRYRLRNSPYFARGVSIEDVVFAELYPQYRWGQVSQSNTLVEPDRAEERGRSATLAASAGASRPRGRAPAADPPPRICGQPWSLDITHDPRRSGHAAEDIWRRRVGRDELGQRSAVLRDHHRSSGLAYLVHDSQTSDLELTRRNRSHGFLRPLVLMKTRSGEHAGAGPGSGLPGKNAMR